MADDLDELGRRLDRIEHALRRQPEGPTRPPAGPEIRSARSIVNRVDDVWVAVTEGNDRLVTAVEGLRTEFSRLAAALLPTDPTDLPVPADPTSRPRTEQRLAGHQTAGDSLDERLSRIEEALARLAASEEPDPTVHLRLNRVEEALAGIAGRLEELAAAAQTTARAGADPDTQAAVDALGSEVRGLAGRVEGLAQALDASAARGADGTLTDRLGRLRDQFRR